MQDLYKKNPDKVLDLLHERLTFERAGVKLYDMVIDHVQQSGDQQLQRMLGQLREHRNEEKEHEEWLEAQIRALGGKANGQSDRSKLVERESEGIEQVIQQDAEPSHYLHALFTAELADNAGWDLLAQIADDADDHGAKREFKKRLHQEEEHLLFMRRAMERLTRREVLHEDVKMPAWP